MRGWFGVLMIPCPLAATIKLIVAFIRSPSTRHPRSLLLALIYGNNIILCCYPSTTPSACILTMKAAA